MVLDDLYRIGREIREIEMLRNAGWLFFGYWITPDGRKLSHREAVREYEKEKDPIRPDQRGE